MDAWHRRQKFQSFYLGQRMINFVFKLQVLGGEPISLDRASFTNSLVRDGLLQWGVQVLDLPDLPMLFRSGLTPLHCAALAHTALALESQKTDINTDTGRFLRLRKDQILEGINCLLQMGGKLEMQVRTSNRLFIMTLCFPICLQSQVSLSFAGTKFMSDYHSLFENRGEY